jgi:hypothetical protein
LKTLPPASFPEKPPNCAVPSGAALFLRSMGL